LDRHFSRRAHDIQSEINDTLNLAIREASGGGSMVRIFSISGIAGALGDMGQNRRTVSLLATSVGLGPMTVLFGCGAAPSLPALATTGLTSRTSSLSAAPAEVSLFALPASFLAGCLLLLFFVVCGTFALGVAVGRYPRKGDAQRQLLLG